MFGLASDGFWVSRVRRGMFVASGLGLASAGKLCSGFVGALVGEKCLLEETFLKASKHLFSHMPQSPLPPCVESWGLGD